MRASCGRTTLRRLVLALLLLPRLAMAADADPAQRCRNLLASVAGREPAAVTPVGPAACEYESAVVGSATTSFRIDRLVLVGAAPDGAPDSAAPGQLHAEAFGIRGAAPAAPAFVQFLLHAQSKPFSVLLDYTRTSGGALQIERVIVDSPTLGAATLAATVEHAPAPFGGDWRSARLRSLRLHLGGVGLFERALGIVAAFTMAKQPDPAAAFRAVQTAALRVVQQGFGPDVASPASSQALTAFLTALPHPTEPFDLWVNLADPVPFDAFADPDRLRAALLPGAVVAAYGE